MQIGLIDVDGHNYPNLALMKLSAWHKAQGDHVEWWWGFGQYDRVYMAKVFDETYSQDAEEPFNTKEIIKGGTGYIRRNVDKKLEYFVGGAWVLAEGRSAFAQYQEFLPHEIEHAFPDYQLYQDLTKDTAFGFLTRGCPRGCQFCIVARKEGRMSHKVADLSEWWNGQKNIVLMDANILACRNHPELLRQLVQSGARIDINQGLDCRLLTEENVAIINEMKIKDIHFAWDYIEESDAVLKGLKLYAKRAKQKPHGAYATVYCLTGFDTTIEEDLFRIYTLRDLGFDPYVMIYNKPTAQKQLKRIQRWCNSKRIFRTTERFEDYIG